MFLFGVYVFVTKTSSIKTQPLHHLLLQMAFWGFCVGKLSDAAADLHADFSNYKFFFSGAPAGVLLRKSKVSQLSTRNLFSFTLVFVFHLRSESPICYLISGIEPCATEAT